MIATNDSGTCNVDINDIVFMMFVNLLLNNRRHYWEEFRRVQHLLSEKFANSLQWCKVAAGDGERVIMILKNDVHG